ncbi:MAG: hypothetical protein ACTSYF_12055 [Promethearchaeota archaeon]
MYGTHLYNAMNKHGYENFITEKIDEAHSLEELNEKEKFYVKEYDSMNPDKEYNMREGGEGGRLHPDTIEKLREITNELAKDPKWHQIISDGLREKWQDPEYRDKVINDIRES